MNGNFLLDTNIVISLFESDSVIIENIQAATNIFIPSIVIGELYYGAYNSFRQNENVERIHQFRKDVNILECDADTAVFYGQTKKELKDKGSPIPENDIWIAALAKQHDLELVTRDKHFQKIDQLRVVKW